jgi:hypothetical protein
LTFVIVPPVAGQAEAPPYPTQYWVKGRIVSGTTGITDLSGFTAIFYKNSGGPWLAYAVAVSDASGGFRINAMDDLRMLPLSAPNYYIGVGSRTVGGRSYGVNERIVAVDATDLSNGFKSVADLTLAEGGGVWVPGEAIPDTGLIQGTQIFRNGTARGSAVRLTWRYKEGSGISRADIWRSSGPELDYAETATWRKIFTTPELQTEYIDFDREAAVGNGINAYYRVVPRGTPDTQIFSLANNTRTAAKIDIMLNPGDLRISTLPLYAGPISGVMDGQVGIDEFYFYPQSGTGLDAKKYINNALVGAPFDVAPGVGFWFENKSTSRHSVTFVGTLETLADREIKPMDITGNCMPYAVNSAGLNAFDGDYIYPPSGTGLGAFRWSATSGGWLGSFTLNNTDGCWYEHAGTRFWHIDLKNGVSVKERP